MPVSLADQFKCVSREVALRRVLYPRWVDQGRLSSTTAAHELEAMAAVQDSIATLLMLEQPRGKLWPKTG
jgi:hypothetical protein